MDIEKIWSELQELPSMILRINKREVSAIAVLDRLSKIVLGTTLDGHCSNCIISTYKQLVNTTYQTLQKMEDQKFKLNPDVIIEYPNRGGNFYNHKTMTDDIARDILLNIPSHIQHFAEYPQVDGAVDLSNPNAVTEAVAEGKDVNKMNKTELQALYAELKGEDAPEDFSKADLLKAVQE